MRHVNLSINQSVSQSVNYSVNQSVNISVNQTIYPSVLPSTPRNLPSIHLSVCFSFIYPNLPSILTNIHSTFLISDFRRDLNIVYFLLGISQASNYSWSTFRNPVSVPSSKAGCTVWRVPSQAEPRQGKVLTGGGDLREVQVDVPLSVSHTCVWSHSWALWQTP